MHLSTFLALLLLPFSLWAETSSGKGKHTPRPAASKLARPAPNSKSAPPPAATPKPERAPNATLEPGDLAEFAVQPPRVQQLLTAALALTKQNVTYTFGGADPAKGGMDCSGTIYYTLRQFGLDDVPRDSPGQYSWVRKAGGFRAVVSKSEESFEFSELLPGDLLFWSGTYSIEREIPITHVMLYLGTEKKTKKRVMFGASDGRSYQGIQRWGVSVFDFKMPRPDPANPEKAKVAFIGYGRIPGLRER
jgi:cell wall-associated NlpC family hydrolase